MGKELAKGDSGGDSGPARGPSWKTQLSKEGDYQRRDTTFRAFIRSDGSTPYAAEAGRYHLYVSYACPWAHRTLILRRLKGLESAISYDVVDWFLPDDGWTLSAKTEGATRDSVNGLKSLRDVYEKASPGYTGSVTVPVLWDKKTSTIVNNESSEIIRMLGGELNSLARHPGYDFYPERLRREIDSVNDWIYPNINNGVYRCGFARSQQAYDRAAGDLFHALDRAEGILEKNRFLTGDRLTEADIRLWTTLVRFDLVYVTHFKCNLRRLVDYPCLWGFTRELYAHPAFHQTTNFTHIKHHYFESHESINPCRIVPIGPELDFTEPHQRDHLPLGWFPPAD
jgi:glutathionyl-hydroquinone reductase